MVLCLHARHRWYVTPWASTLLPAQGPGRWNPVGQAVLRCCARLTTSLNRHAGYNLKCAVRYSLCAGIHVFQGRCVHAATYFNHGPWVRKTRHSSC